MRLSKAAVAILLCMAAAGAGWAFPADLQGYARSDFQSTNISASQYSIQGSSASSLFAWGDDNAWDRSTLRFSGSAFDNISLDGPAFTIGSLSFINDYNSFDLDGTNTVQLLARIYLDGLTSPVEYALTLRLEETANGADRVVLDMNQSDLNRQIELGGEIFTLSVVGLYDEEGRPTQGLTSEEPRNWWGVDADSAFLWAQLRSEDFKPPKDVIPASAPEPATVALFGLSAATALWRARRRRRK